MSIRLLFNSLNESSVKNLSSQQPNSNDMIQLPDTVWNPECTVCLLGRTNVCSIFK